MSRTNIFKHVLFVVILLIAGVSTAEEKRPNIVLITADDLGYEYVNCMGGKVANVTPNMDRLATQGMQFNFAHSNYAICAPSRGIIATGRYAHDSGLFGFNRFITEMPTVFRTLQENGYLTGILGKVDHSTPDMNFTWDYAVDKQDLGDGRSPTRYYEATVEFIKGCQERGTPFYLMANSHDPHYPLYNPEDPEAHSMGQEVPSRLFSPQEVFVAPQLEDLPAIRKELSYYYNSVRRLDDTLGKLMQALEDTGVAENTLVLYMSDNGSPLPFAKFNTYLASTRTPCFVRWPGQVKQGTVDNEHFVSEVDWFPTFMEVAGIPAPAGLQGRSIVPLLKGQKQQGRDVVFTEIDYSAGGPCRPMRSIQDKRYIYIFNAWSKGDNEPSRYQHKQPKAPFQAMEAAGKTNPDIQARVDMYKYRQPEEFYDIQIDPGCRNNLIDNPEYSSLIKQFQGRLQDLMEETDDHCLEFFKMRNNPRRMMRELADYPKLNYPEGSKKPSAIKPGWQ